MIVKMVTLAVLMFSQACVLAQGLFLSEEEIEQINKPGNVDIDPRVILAREFLIKMFEDTPFSLADEKYFFGEFGGGMGMMLYSQLGMINDSGTEWKISPGEVSYLGELLRMHRDQFVPDESNEVRIELMLAEPSHIYFAGFNDRGSIYPSQGDGSWSSVVVFFWKRPTDRNLLATLRISMLSNTQNGTDGHVICLDLSHIGNYSVPFITNAYKLDGQTREILTRRVGQARIRPSGSE